MKQSEINTRDYWEERFSSGDWEKYGGGEQSAFFSKIAIDAFPAWLKRELSQNAWNVADWGCAEGSGTAVLARRFPACRFVGIDFSPAAVEEAEKKYPYCNFRTGDVLGEIECTDVIFCSNVLEHMKEPLSIMEKLAAGAKQHAIFLVPLHDQSDISEHFYIFDEAFFPVRFQRHILSYFQIIDCSRMNSPYWKDKQLLLVYSEEEAYKKIAHTLSDLFSNAEYDQLKIQLDRTEAELISERARLSALEKNEQELRRDADLRVAELETALSQKGELARQVDMLREEIIQQKERKILLDEAHDQIKRLEEMDCVARAELDSRLALLRETENNLTRVLRICESMTKSRLFRIVHMLNRWKRQGFHHEPAERKAFRKWLWSRFVHKTPDHDHRFNPLYQIILPLSSMQEMLASFIASTAGAAEPQTATLPMAVEHLESAPETMCSCLEEPYTHYDVIVFSVIDYDFRYQRPQQIADHFSREGHRVFYINANFKSEGGTDIRKKAENLWIVTLANQEHSAVYSTDFKSGKYDLNDALDDLVMREGIRDALLIADYPNWVSGLTYLKKRYGFVLVTDYMDDYSGFDNAEEAFIERACVQLLKSSDLVVASSQYLENIAKEYNQNIELIRNGTEYEHFHQAAVGSESSKKKVIGYYGAIAHWFDFPKIEFLSKRFPDCEIILIGAVTAGEKRLKKLQNVSLLGEKRYEELPEYLREFDVCLIPFDASTNLIQATNPVKFYEYLSAGKKIVATEIPELEAYRDRFVYLSNDNEQFAEYVQKCLDGTDTLAKREECMAFARENDWTVRVQQFSQAVEQEFPAVSIIVLCYNQLDYTKQCVESILQNTAYPNYELVLVDNHSTDGTKAWLEEIVMKSSRIKLVLNQENLGFAGGNNAGIRASNGEYIVLLNNDTLVTRGWLSGLVKRFRTGRKDIGMVGPVTNSIGNEAQIDLGYTDVKDMWHAAYNYTAKHMGEDYPHTGILAMFCVMFRRSLTEQIGLLDENYGVGMFEDDDYSMAVHKSGYKCILAEDVFIHHFGSVSFKKLENVEYRKLFEKNRAYFEKKWNTKWKMHKYRPIK